MSKPRNNNNVTKHDLDLGHDHWLRFTCWKPDRKLNSQYADLPDMDKVGAIVGHKTKEGKACEGSILFDSEVTRRAFAKNPKWTVVQWEPLTLTPSLLCTCGDHGFIREGKWVVA